MIEQNYQQLFHSPIIIVQDSSYGNVSTTTNDILTQTELLRYSSNLKGVDLDQFMQMTDARDFERFGIRKHKDCRKLSTIAQSIRRSSLGSSSYDDDDVFESSDSEDISLTVSPVIGPSSRAKADQSNKGARIWPNSMSKRLAKLTLSDYEDRRLSLPSLSPPEYWDCMLEKTRRRHSSTDIEQQLQDEKEKLPKYSCSVQKMGKGSAKMEYDLPGVKARHRSWRDVYIELQGTVLKVYELKNAKSIIGGYHYLPTITPYYQDSVKYSPLVDLSLANAKVDPAIDYTKRRNVFRVTTESGPQVLFQVQTNAAASLWIEKISAGCNIAVDIEHQRMPKFPPTTISFIEPYEGWNSENESTRLTYQRYLDEDIRRRDSQTEDCLL